MKCYTVTNDGVVPGIQFLRQPYLHVAVGDPNLSSADYKRVEVDAALADGGDRIMTCSYTIDTKNAGNRKSSYKLVANSGDDDRALVKFDAHGDTPGQRTFYDMPRHTRALANGWRLASEKGPQVATPVNLVVMEKGAEIKIQRMVDIGKPAELVFSVSFDGAELKQTRPRAAA